MGQRQKSRRLTLGGSLLDHRDLAKTGRLRPLDTSAISSDNHYLAQRRESAAVPYCKCGIRVHATIPARLISCSQNCIDRSLESGKRGPALILHRARQLIGPVFALGLFGFAVHLLMQEASQITWDEFKEALIGVPPIYLLFATFLIALNYGLLISYDLLALRYICRSLPLRRVALVSFLGYSLGNNLGTLIAATPIRFRFYSQWGLSPSQIVVLIAVLGLTFWSGLWFLGGVVLVAVPIELPKSVSLPFGTQTLGVILLSLAIGYLIICSTWRKPWPMGKLKLRPPEPGLMAVQASIAAVDLLISATALYLVLPAGAEVPFAMVLAAYLVGIAISLITQVPGGLGVLEVILLKLLKDSVGDGVLASLLIFRTLYYLLPLLFGMATMVAFEIYSGALQVRQASSESE